MSRSDEIEKREFAQMLDSNKKAVLQIMRRIEQDQIRYFKRQLKHIADSVQQAHFIAVDGEFTGLDAGNGTQITVYDTPEERYHKLRQGSADFLLFQFGVCTFHYIDKKKKYEARPFTFYLFPRPYTKNAPDCRFQCQSSSLDFLAGQGFDFNKVFKEGINYLDHNQEVKLREALEKKHAQYAQFSSPAFVTPDGAQGTSKGPVNIPEEHEGFIKDIHKKVSEFLENTEGQKLELPPCTGFQRKLIYQSVRSEFTSAVHLETKTGEKKDRFIVVTRISGEEDMKKKEAEKQEAERTELDDAVGFTKVIRMISESGKMVAGHNMFLDIIHILHQFMYPLPESYEEFKSMTTCAFPKLLDTKLMASTNPFKDLVCSTILGELQTALEAEPFKRPEVVLPKEFPQYTSNEGRQLHDAGYDAYVTGICFICMANYLGSFQKPPSTKVTPSSPLIQPFINKLFLMRVSDIPYINLTGPDLTPNRDHVFHVQFPADWRTTDLYQLFSPFGNIQIGWLDDTSAYVTLHNREEAPKVTECLCNKLSPVYRVLTYHQFKMSPPHYMALSRKRTSGASDGIGLPPSKKRKSLNAESITPPVPEDNSDQMDIGQSTGNGDAKKEVTTKEDKMFEEPPSW